MEELNAAGPGAIGTLLRRLSDRSTEGLSQVCAELELDLEPRWFACIRLLRDHGPLGVTEIARALDQTHPGVIQLARILETRGLIRERRDANDERRRLLVLSRRGKELALEAEPLWNAMEGAARRWLEEAGVDLPGIVRRLQDLLDEEPMDERIRKELRLRDYQAVQIEPMGKGDEAIFADLNRAWIEAYFGMEPEDRRVLFHPRDHILRKGGKVFMARLEGETVGTCALLRIDDQTFELAKMAVDPDWRGRQVGARLCDHAIAEAVRMGGETLLLQTNRLLETAVNLYRSRGWVDQEDESGEEGAYERANLRMRLDLTEMDLEA